MILRIGETERKGPPDGLKRVANHFGVSEPKLAALQTCCSSENYRDNSWQAAGRMRRFWIRKVAEGQGGIDGGMFGIMNLYKPAGVTSRDVLNEWMRRNRFKKAGHAGTLDPLADGVLLVAVGKSTRLIPYLQELSKEYCGTFELGLSSDTQDITGDCRAVPWEPSMFNGLPEIRQQFVGRISQVPPVFSALKVQGKRAYELGRRGAVVDLPPREVVVDELEIVDCQPPKWTMRVKCSKGTYVRTLGRDIGVRMGSDAVMTALTRLAVGGYHVAQSIRVEEWESTPRDQQFVDWRPIFADRLTIVATAEQAEELKIAKRFDWRVPVEGAVVVDEAGRLLAVLDYDSQTGYRYAVNFWGQ